MASEEEKLEIQPDRTVDVREMQRLFRLTPVADNDLTRPSRQVAIVAADPEDEARQIASMHDVFQRDLRDPHFAVGDAMETPERIRLDLPLRAGGGRRAKTCGEALVTWNARGSGSFCDHDHFRFPTA
jgi:hypothetical protein